MEVSSYDYESSLKTKSMSSLISEMAGLRFEIKQLQRELNASLKPDRGRGIANQKEAVQSKILAVEVEIGRRLRF